MLDPTTISALATNAMALLTPLLIKATEGAAEEVGKSTVSSLLAKLKQRLIHPSAQEALDDLAQQPVDSAAQGALTMQLRKALAADPGLEEFFKEWMKDAAPAAGITQTATVQGNQNKTVQIAGSGNSVG